VPVFTAGSLLALGLDTPVREALAPLAQRRFVLVTLAAGWLVCPGVAWLLLAIVPLDGPYATGLLVLSLAPAAPFVPAMARIARADPGHTAAFMLLGTIATVAIMPVALPALAGGGAPPQRIARPLVLFVLLPLVAGLLIRRNHDSFAARILRPVTLVTNTAGAVLLATIVPLYGGGIVSAVGSYAIATQIVFVAAVTGAAYAGGAVLPPGARRVLTLGMCSRNLGAALAPLALIESDPRAMVMIAIAAPVTLAGSIVTARWLALRRTSVADSA
jgi:BASS family bile acid:Na+ symporter